MSLAEKLQQPPRPRNKIQAILDELHPQDREAVVAALNDPSIAAEYLARVLTEEGYAVGATTIRTYRRSVKL